MVLQAAGSLHGLLTLLPHAHACPSRAVQAEIVNIQKEKERIATTTIDDELAADPQMAKVGSWRHTHYDCTAYIAARGTGAACSVPVAAAADAPTDHHPRLCTVCVLQEVDEEVQKNHFLVN